MSNGGLTPTEEKLLRKHCGCYIEKYQRVRLPGSDEQISRQVRTLAYEKPQPDQLRQSRQDLGEKISTSEANLLASLCVNSARRIFVTGDGVTGDGGSGKSEFTRQIAYGAAVNAIDSLKSSTHIIPLRYELGNLNPAHAIQERIESEFEAALLPASTTVKLTLKRLADQGRLLFILDGLDELRRGTAADFHNKLVDFIMFSKNCPVVIAGREASMQRDWATCLNLRKEDTFRLEPLTIEAIHFFIRDYFAGDNAQRFTDLLLGVPGVMPLLRQPFMLAMACLAVSHKRTAKVDLPADSYQIMAYGLMNLLQRRRGKRRFTLSARAAFDVLQRLAALSLLQDFRFTLEEAFPTSITIEELTPQQVLNQLAPHSGILTVQGLGELTPEYSFTNRVVAEYLAGTYIAAYGPLEFNRDVYDTQICGDTWPSGVSPVPGSSAALARSLAFYGRHIWSDQKRDTLKWIAAGWWRCSTAGQKTALRAARWLLSHVDLPSFESSKDDIRGTLVSRFLDQLRVCPLQEISKKIIAEFKRALNHVVKPTYPFLLTNSRTEIEMEEFSGLPRSMTSVYVRSLINHIADDKSDENTIHHAVKWLKLLAADESDVVKTALAVLSRRIKSCRVNSYAYPLIGRSMVLLARGQSVIQDRVMRLLFVPLIDGTIESHYLPQYAKILIPIVAANSNISNLLSTTLRDYLKSESTPPYVVGKIAVLLCGFPNIIPEIMDEIAEALHSCFCESLGGIWANSLVESVVEMSAWVPGLLEDARVMLLRLLKNLSDDDSDYQDNVVGLAKAIKAIEVWPPDRAREAMALLCNHVRNCSYTLVPVLKAMIHIGVHEQRIVDDAIEIVSRVIENERDVYGVMILAETLTELRPRDEMLRIRAITTLFSLLAHGDLDYIVQRNIGECLVRIGIAWPKIAATLLALGADDELMIWHDFVVIRGRLLQLQSWADIMRWIPKTASSLEPRCELNRLATPVVIAVDSGNHYDTSAPNVAELSPPPDPNRPAFLLASRETLRPGLDSHLLPPL